MNSKIKKIYLYMLKEKGYEVANCRRLDNNRYSIIFLRPQHIRKYQPYEDWYERVVLGE